MTDKQMTEYLEKIDRVIENGEYKADWGSLAESPVPWTKKMRKQYGALSRIKCSAKAKSKKQAHLTNISVIHQKTTGLPAKQAWCMHLR